jgi:hypothetical protein
VLDRDQNSHSGIGAPGEPGCIANTSIAQPSVRTADGQRVATNLRVAYHVVATSGEREVIALDSCYDLPRALEKDFLPLTEDSCSKLFELLVMAPLQTAIRAFLQHRFEELQLHSGDAESTRTEPVRVSKSA